MGIYRIESFIHELSKTSNEIAIKILCEKELNYLRNEYHVADVANEFGIYEGLATYKKAITVYRKAIYDYDKEHIGYNLFKMNEKDSQNMKYQNGISKMRNYVNRMEGIIYRIDNPQEYLNQSKQLLTATSYIDNILGLAALTGRRVNEIGYASEFDICNDNEVFDNFYMFDDLMDLELLDFIAVYGLSKKQTYLMDKNTNDNAIIPVLTDKEKILRSIAELRKTRKFNGLDDFHNKTSKELSRKVKKYYSDFIGKNCKTHDLRKVYARLCYDLLIYDEVKNDDGLHTFTELVLKQSVPDNYMKFVSTRR